MQPTVNPIAGSSPSRQRQMSLAPARERAEREADVRARDWTAGNGRPLQPRLSHQLSRVPVHADAEAKERVAQEHARALVEDGEIWIDPSELRPETASGRELLAHELAHVAQQREGDAPERIQRDDKKEQPKLGLGSRPPVEEFTSAEGAANEQEHVLFAYDSDSLAPDQRKKLESWATRQFIPVVVELHGYASHEGPDQYNRNLSAHRAVAVKYALEALLPLGSRVELIAHGETGGFDTPDANRRVGMSSRMKPLELSMPGLGQGGLGKQPSFGLGGQPPYLTPPTFSPVTPPTLFPPPITLPPGSGSGALDPSGEPPAPFVPPYPVWTAPDLYRFPGGVPEPYWPGLAQPYTDRGLTMGEGDMDIMRGMATQNLGLLNLTEGLYRGPYNWARRNFKFLDLDPLSIAKPKWASSLAASAASTQLSFDNPTGLEAANRDAARFGLPEPTMIPIPGVSFDLQGDAVKKSQEAAKRREEEAKKKKGSH